MSDPLFTNGKAFREYWSRAMTSMMWNQWLMLDGGLRAAQMVLALAAANAAPRGAGARPAPGHAGPKPGPNPDDLIRRAEERIKRGLAPPREVYQTPYRDRIDWSRFPDWARPTDPELFEGAGHEG
jgi:hypothetical protein